jgi:hypothetical protein
LEYQRGALSEEVAHRRATLTRLSEQDRNARKSTQHVALPE